MQLSDVVIKSSEASGSRLQTLDDWQLKSSLENSHLKFSFQDGKIEDICPSDEETTSSLNLKRGLLSAFQNSMSQHDSEEDMQEVKIKKN